MIERLAAALHAAGLKLDGEGIADALWLAAFAMPRQSVESAAGGQAPPPAPTPPGAPPAPGDDSAAAAASERGRTTAEAGDGPAPSARTGTALVGDRSEPAVAELLPRTGDSPERGRRAAALPIRVPAAPPLPGARELARALRPLRRRRASHTEGELDLDATIRDLADQQCWLPTLRPARGRWLELALVIDHGPSMLIWQRTAREIRRLCERLGAFRHVKVWGLATGESDKARLFSGDASVARSERELLDGRGERLILVLSDAVSPAWERAVPPMLARWAKRQPVALWQMFPAHFWRKTALGTAVEAKVHAPAGATPNGRFRLAFPPGPPGWIAPAAPAFPVIVAETSALRTWAKFVTQGGGLAGPALVLDVAEPPLAAPPAEAATAAERVAFFQCNASPAAFRLACLLAAAPLQLPIMRLIQQAMMPGAGQLRLAEVFVSGLLERTTPADSAARPDEVEFAFADGVAELLLGGSRGAESLQVLKTVSEHLNRRFGAGLDFSALVRSPGYLGDLPVRAALRPFATVAARVLRLFGGRYAQAARAVERRAWRAARAQDRRETTAWPTEEIWRGRQLLWVGGGANETMRERDALAQMGAHVELPESTAAALDTLKRRPIDGIIAMPARVDEVFYVDMQTRSSAVPAVLYGVADEREKRRLLAWGALLVTDKFHEVTRALARVFLSRSSGAALVRGLTLLQSARLRKALGGISEDAFAIRAVLERPSSETWLAIWKSCEDKEEALLAMVSLLTQVFVQSSVLFWIVDGDRRHLAACVLREGSPEQHRQPSVAVLEAISREETIFQSLARLGAEPAFTPGLRALLAVPMNYLNQGKLAGVLGLESPAAAEFSAMTTHLWLETLLQSLATAWETLPGKIPEAVEPQAEWATVRLETAGETVRYSIRRPTRENLTERAADPFGPDVVIDKEDGASLDLSELRGLVNTLSGGDARVVGKAFFHNVFPPDVGRAFRRLKNIIWEIDPALAFFPWELLDPTPEDKGMPPAVAYGSVRQMRLGNVPALRLRSDARTVVVVGAQSPGIRNADRVESWQQINTSAIVEALDPKRYDVQSTVGRPAELARMFLSPGLVAVHLTGETFASGDDNRRPRVGFSGDGSFSATTLADFKTVPEFVFINANRSGEIFAEALLRRGVSAVVCLGLQGAEPATAEFFANAFWQNLAAGSSVATSMQAARLRLFRDHPKSLEWAAYQCYGDPLYRLPTPPRPLVEYLDFVETSPLAAHSWKSRGKAPIGFLKGMTLVYMRSLLRLENGDRFAQEMAKPVHKKDSPSDVLARMRKNLNSAGLPDADTPSVRLRRLFVLLFGLAMMESSGDHQLGRDLGDRGASSPEKAEAGLFQTSYNSHGFHLLLPALLKEYREGGPACYSEIFAGGAASSRDDGEGYIGSGPAREFQELSSRCPAFAVEYAAIVLRNNCEYYAPIGRRSVEIVRACNALLLEAEQAAQDQTLRNLIMADTILQDPNSGAATTNAGSP